MIYYRDLRPLFQPRSLAIVGASEKPGPGSMALINVRLAGFSGPVYAVNPRYPQVHGFPCFPSLSGLPDVPDCVGVAVPSALAPGIVRDAAACGARAVVVYGSGFAESGPEGQALQRELRTIATEHDLPICGPNCIGLINLQNRFAAYSAPLPDPLPLGRVGAVVQSGSVCIGLLNSGRGVGFSYLISSGNEAATECADYIHYLALDPSTDVIVAFVEGFRDTAKLADAASVAAKFHKPIIVVKVGRSELSRRAVQAHTGALAGSDEVHEAFFRRHGIIRVRDLDEMLEAAQLFLKATLPKGPGVGAITVSGGQVGLMADLAEEEGIVFPELGTETRAQMKAVLPAFTNVGNPLDAWGNGDLTTAYPRCLEVLAQDPAVDLVAVCQDAPAGLSKAQAATYQNVARAAAGVASGTTKPVVFFGNISSGFETSIRTILSEGGVAQLQGTRESLRAIGSLIRYSDFLRRGQPAVPAALAALDPAVMDLLTRPVLTEHESKQVLAAYGIPTTRERLAATLLEAEQVAAEIGYPVVLKIDSPEISHKTEASAVRTGIRDPQELSSAFAEVLRNARAFCPSADIRGVLVQEMVDTRRATELIAGLSWDPQFGHAIIVGLGGVFVEVYRDAALRLVPVDEEEALAMLRELKGRPILEGARGRPRADLRAIARVVVGLSNMALQLGPRIAAVDINPLFALPEGEGVRAADALVLTAAKGG